MPDPWLSEETCGRAGRGCLSRAAIPAFVYRCCMASVLEPVPVTCINRHEANSCALLDLGPILQRIKMSFKKKKGGSWRWKKPTVDTPFQYPPGCCNRCMQSVIPASPHEIISWGVIPVHPWDLCKTRFCFFLRSFPCALLQDFPLPIWGQTPISQVPGLGRSVGCIRGVPFQAAPARAQGLPSQEDEEGNGFPKRVSLVWWCSSTCSSSWMLELRWVCAWPGFGHALKRFPFPLEQGRHSRCREQPRGGDAGKWDLCAHQSLIEIKLINVKPLHLLLCFSLFPTKYYGPCARSKGQNLVHTCDLHSVTSLVLLLPAPSSTLFVLNSFLILMSRSSEVVFRPAWPDSSDPGADGRAQRPAWKRLSIGFCLQRMRDEALPAWAVWACEIGHFLRCCRALRLKWGSAGSVDGSVLTGLRFLPETPWSRETCVLRETLPLNCLCAASGTSWLIFPFSPGLAVIRGCSWAQRAVWPLERDADGWRFLAVGFAAHSTTPAGSQHGCWGAVASLGCRVRCAWAAKPFQ